MMDVIVAQMILTLELNFFEAFNLLLDHSSYQLATDDKFIRKAFPEWRKNNLKLLLVNVRNFRETIKEKYIEACFNIDEPQCSGLDCIILSALERLDLKSSNMSAALREENFPKIKVLLGRRIKKAIREISQEIDLYLFIKDIKSTIHRAHPEKTAEQLYSIRISLSAYLYKDGVENLNSTAFTIINHYWNALNYAVIRHISQPDKSENKVQKLIFWLDVLKGAEQLGDKHSVLAIYLALSSLNVQTVMAPVFALLPEGSRDIESEMEKKYSEVSINPGQLNQSQTIAPYVGAYRSLVFTHKENFRLVESILQVFDLVTLFLSDKELKKIIKLYKAERPAKIHEYFLKISKIPENIFRQKLPQKLQDKTPQELSNYMEREFEAAILKPYRKILTNYKELVAFIREKRVQRDELKLKMDENIDQFRLITLQASDEIQRLLQSQQSKCADNFLSSIITRVADTVNQWNDSQVLVTSTQSSSVYTENKVLFFTGSLKEKRDISSEDSAQASSSCSPKTWPYTE